jgi:TIR domain
MADIFISYSKSDHALALKLSAFLESEGWSVWWDKSLGAADLYRDEIMKQLAAARAVITIWTENSIRSDWVRAEAGRAKADGKLIPVKTSELTYGDIPLPFGEMQTENLESNELIRAAVVTQLSKPAVQQSAFWQITSTFKYQILTWAGIVGSAMTVFANLNDVLHLADWAKILVAHWHEWTQVFWGWVFSLFQVKIPGEFVPILSFSAFTGMLVLGLNLSSWIGRQSGRSNNEMPVMRKVYLFGGGMLIYLVTVFSTVWVAATDFLSWFPPGEVVITWQGTRIDTTVTAVLGLIAAVSVLYVIAVVIPIAYLLYFLKERSWVLTASLVFLVMSVCLLFVPMLFGVVSPSFESVLSAFVLLQTCLMAAILFSPIRQLTRRLAFVLLGVATLVGLSEISKLNLHRYLQPAKLSKNLSSVEFSQLERQDF